MHFEIDDLDLQMNHGGKWAGLTLAPSIDFEASSDDGVFEVLTGGEKVELDFDHRTVGFSVGHALIQIDDFIYVEGGFALTKQEGVRVDIITGYDATPSLASAAGLGTQLAALAGSDHSRRTTMR
ncbi:hypothetical protein HK414_16080 [Ramlibacter terrae]|uniref:Uncharacterized protein n=1 Tax=Ramlibacter terrae TaxID=2732511 RepID=A0ABX6P3K8_9BURK|nr:hypothetical protein HK414_16080 [Ramlibacter terrae]